MEERICTFFGHRNTFLSQEELMKLESVIAELIEEGINTFFFGGFGEFDRACGTTVQKLKRRYPYICLHFVTPYIAVNNWRLKEAAASGVFDSIIYPGLEDVHYKAAIEERNKYMVNKAECVIAYVNYAAGGAYQACRYAGKNGKRLINLGGNNAD